MTYLLIENASKAYGDIQLFQELNLVINKGQKIALVAKNGAGKTTLLNIISGKDSFESGRLYINKNIKVGYLEQNPLFNPDQTVFEALYSAPGELMMAVRSYEKAVHSGSKELLENVIATMDHLNAWDYDAKIRQMLTVLKLEDLDIPLIKLSGGQLKRLALAVTLINEPDFLILDEPTNHLDLDMIEWLEEYLTKSQITLLMVTHDRYFLDRICNEIIELDEKLSYSYKGNYSYYLEKRSERIAAKSLSTEKSKNLYKTELEWMRRMPQARSTKSKSRIDAFYKIKEEAGYARNDKQVEIQIQSSRLGSKILEMNHVSKSFGDNIMLTDFSYTFSRMERVGIVGRNGVGKSTFLNLITQNMEPDAGKIDTGETVVYGYYRQQNLQYDPKQRVIDILSEIAEVIQMGDGSMMTLTQFLNLFLFPPSMHYVLVDKLSGGEKRRLYLMTVLMRNPNFLILDEPTNDLDIITLNVLEDYLSGFNGCLIIVSHDRFFMDKLVNHLFIFEGSGEVSDFPGNYSDYRISQKNLDRNIKRNATVDKPKKQNVSFIQSESEKKKPSYKIMKEIQELETEMQQLETEKKALEQEISSGTLSTEILIDKSNRIGEVMRQIDLKTDRWLEISQ